MRKMKLDVETLAVDSFRTAAANAEARGTVRAHVTMGSSCLNSCYTCRGLTCEYTGSPCVAC
jgi:hypothetical protein